ncbi:ARF GTPase activator [Myxozyma melibiosi]|uniref:ADP-ribosylation factor GTPase-activating protein n=1 Tax=Myxozyma melibiosi TaxID=54550 RepID=A0ABR1F005_9ASCO
MGVVTSRPDEAGSVYLTDQSRFSISSISVVNYATQRPILRIAPTADRRGLVPVREEGSPMIEFVQDIEPNSLIPILLKLLNDGGLEIKFKLALNKSAAEGFSMNGLTFMNSCNGKQIDTMLTKELQSDPNIQKRQNVMFIGDYSANQGGVIEFEWTWVWSPPSDLNEVFNGWRNTCVFAEYNRHEHKLSKVAQFSFWVQDATRSVWSIPQSPRQLNIARFGSPSNFSDDSGLDGYQGKGSAAAAEVLENPEAYSVPLAQISTSSSSASASGVLSASSSKADEGTSYTEDGPLFRATVASLERKTVSLKAVIKKLLKRTIQMHETQEQYCAAYAGFLESLREASKDLVSLRPAVETFFDTSGRDILKFEKRSSGALNSHVIEPLRRLYDVDIKAADAKKREFDDDSKEYYAWLSRYLSMKQEAKGKKKHDGDTKYQDKRKVFELKRFDYYTFIQDMHGGRKANETAYQLSAYASAVVKSFEDTFKSMQLIRPQIDGMLSSMKEKKDTWTIRRTEREEKRRALERSAMPDPTLNGPGSSGLVSSGADEYSRKSAQPSLMTSPAPRDAAKSAELAHLAGGSSGGTDDDDSQSDRRKEGLLWAMSRPGGHSDPRNLNKPGWHKFWVVLAGGQLCEYTNWKQSVELHNDPINLRMASVREARGTDRRFCFEVITLQYRRIYQATSEEDMYSWITAISNAISSTIEGGETKDPAAAVADRAGGGGGDSLFPKPSPSTPVRQGSPVNTRSGGLVGDSEGYDGTEGEIQPSPITTTEKRESLLRRVREADAENAICADCGNSSKVEWVSINLMVVLCIECSGLHRSLGTHISKMRSLTLDTTSFTADFVEALVRIGNRNANMVWEGQPNAKIAKKEMQRVIAEQQQQQQQLQQQQQQQQQSQQQQAQTQQSSPQAQQIPQPHFQHLHIHHQQPQQQQQMMSRSPQSPATTAGGSASGSSGGAARQARLAFITQKYVDRAFVARVPQPMAALWTAVRKQSIVDVLHALASGAKVDAPAQDGDIFLSALVHAGGEASAFAVAELLFQNGAKVPSEVPAELRMSAAAAAYIARKQGRSVGEATQAMSSMLLDGGRQRKGAGGKVGARSNN